MSISGKRIGFGLTGSFCTLQSALAQMQKLVLLGADVIPVVSYAVKSTDTRFGTAEYFLEQIKMISGKECIASIADAEPIGPSKKLDLMVVLPCTGNTLAKLANGITDTPVTMACKAHLRNNRPVLLGIATNDGLGANAKNIGLLMNTKNIYFVPFRQDDPENKHNSLVCRMDLFIPAVEAALEGRQLEPVLV
ncbi:dipicolinate synthase B chain [Thermoclostridium stercorarium subsp. stercorarium DSM 8532]|jgi:dipicolinate synthase subunit B|uniref:Dipicolinate synthase B chain n=3 Tax=Thermoclostridium stercorarium TaxID=1510 RepID=L7VQW2_THES1|nr:dipicolinate synthase subunit B [Thermoclostridium stercorarium]AGC69064.1 dipicolinate synthase B chain [Thermoclostridium stercorarium subsp. stercorarium DSM 8532]AGI40036.1 dipicolinic acid synthetase subunit B [Thermoclostridium stercorarium subsp. stercorarium DSM 8532]ANW99356.1 dipicolinate synthase subunit B [Thermoclostridium stercorarium subsp. thermolacticum DSM 2910]ANX01984.1 dipicolinate synthase subunit B [Thermoclostridium stercorarium subsp. leptospartum DSM 9219]UZQ85025.